MEEAAEVEVEVEEVVVEAEDFILKEKKGMQQLQEASRCFEQQRQEARGGRYSFTRDINQPRTKM